VLRGSVDLGFLTTWKQDAGSAQCGAGFPDHVKARDLDREVVQREHAVVPDHFGIVPLGEVPEEERFVLGPCLPELLLRAR
jgi:hypothetical protein